MNFERIKKILGTLFLSYKLSPEEKKFIELNQKHWSHRHNGEVGILVEGFLDSPTSIVEKSRLANAAREASGLNVKVLVRGMKQKASNVIPIYRSFGINNFFCWWLNYINPGVVFFSLCSFFYVLFFLKNGNKLVDYRKDDILIGDLIYDSLIRNIPNSYTIDRLSLFSHGRVIFRSLCFYYGNKNILKKNDILFVVSSHNVYAEYGMLCRQAHARGATILLKDMDVYKMYTPQMNINEHFLKADKKVIDEAFRCSDLTGEISYYQSRVLGISAQIDIQNAFKNKKTYTKKESLSLHSDFSDEKVCVFVMAHAFSDAPHVGEGLLFKDYYDFLEKTLITLNGNNDINCFVKAHPSSYMWGEKGGVEAIVEKNKLNHVCILPMDYNTNSIIDIADVIVTAKGTAGLEFSCAGIPAITAGKGYYHGFGICFEPESVSEFYKMLSEIKNIKRLDDDKIRKALIVLYHSFNNLFHSDVLPKVQIRPGDNYQLLYRGKFAEMVFNMENGILMKDDFYYMVLSDAERCINEK
ncbi:hypothetical protein [Aeromonas media]|uniref:capsular polysaccharide export protein, LipB/KpsS family n=1 Tax=Aeromonas media TaxID=651 RepID=UPI003D1DEF61